MDAACCRPLQKDSGGAAASSTLPKSQERGEAAQ